MKVVFTSLIILFAVEDLIGSQHANRLERWWLNRATNIFQSWRSVTRKSFKWWKILILLINIIVSSAVNLVILVSIVYRFFAPDSFGIVDYLKIVFAYGLVMIVSLVTYYALLMYFKKFLDLSRNIRPPIEVRCMRVLIKPMLAFENAIYDNTLASPEKNITLPIIILTTLTAVVAPAVIIPIVVFKCLLYLLILSVWLVLFAPATCLHLIAKRTGGESYLKVAKYIVVLIAAICS